MLIGQWITPELKSLFDEVLDSLDPHLLASRMKMGLEADVNQLLSECDLPTLIVGAKEDLLIRQDRIRDLAALRRTTVEWIDGPHLLIQSRPQQFREVLERFFDQLLEEGVKEDIIL